MEVNVEKIMEDIRAEIKEKGYTSDVLSFNDAMEKYTMNNEQFDSGELVCNIATASAVCVVPYDRPIYGNRIAVFIKRLIRKLIRFYIRPAIEQQNEFNVSMSRAMSTVGKYTIELHSDSVLDRMNQLEAKLKQVNEENEELRRRLEKLEASSAEKTL